MKKKSQVRRAIKIEGLDVELELSKATSVRTDKQMIHFDQLKDGSWRLIYNENLIPDFSKVRAFTVIREGESDVHQRGRNDAYQDRCENCHFSSVGGLESRSNMQVPSYISEEQAEEYLEGYRAECLDLFGEDWETCEFIWKPALII